MVQQFIIHSCAHTTLALDVSNLGIPTKVIPRDGQLETVHAIRFQTWKDAERYFTRLGADSKALEDTLRQLKKSGVTMLTIT